MIVSELVLHHTYARGVAFDLSGKGNHGFLQGVAMVGGNAVFDGGSDAIRVKVSPTLIDLRAIRVQVRFKISFGTPVSHRCNLIEGYRCFALYVNQDWSLQGTIVDGFGAWKGALSPPHTVQPNTWHTATFLHDGFSTARLWLDGVLVAEAYDVIGPVGRVWTPHALAIGHWPDPYDQYTLEGEIAEVKVWRADPSKVRDVIDDCCVERSTLDEIIHEAHEQGFYKEDLDSVMDDLITLGHQMVGAFASPDQASRDHARELGRKATMAISLSNGAALRQLLADTAGEIAAKVPAAEIQQKSDQLLAIMDRTPAGPTLRTLIDAAVQHQLDPSQPLPPEVDRWAGSLCLDWALPPRRPPKRRPKSEDPRPESTGEDPEGEGWGADGDRHVDRDPASGDDKEPPR